jgi:hypothetical protein
MMSVNYSSLPLYDKRGLLLYTRYRRSSSPIILFASNHYLYLSLSLVKLLKINYVLLELKEVFNEVNIYVME